MKRKSRKGGRNDTGNGKSNNTGNVFDNGNILKNLYGNSQQNNKGNSNNVGNNKGNSNINLPMTMSMKQFTGFDPTLKKLVGPIRLRYYKNIEGKRILLLGEHHNLWKPCKVKNSVSNNEWEVDKWLEYIATNSPVCLDIFMEESYFLNKKIIEYKGGSDNEAYIHRIRESFIPEIKGDIYKNETETWHYSKFNSTRYHHVDIRQVYSLYKRGVFFNYDFNLECEYDTRLLIFQEYFNEFLENFYSTIHVFLNNAREEHNKIKFYSYKKILQSFFKTIYKTFSLENFEMLLYDIFFQNIPEIYGNPINKFFEDLSNFNGIENTKYLLEFLYPTELENQDYISYVNEIYIVLIQVFNNRFKLKKEKGCNIKISFDSILLIFSKYLFKKSKLSQKYKDKFNLHNISQYYRKDVYQTNYKYMYKVSAQHPKYGKWDKIDYKYSIDNILEIFDIINYENFNEDFFYKNFYKIKYFIYIINSNFFYFNSCIMDLYTLERMFKTFDMSGEKGERGPKICRNQDTPKYIIFYGGAAHTDRYAYFFETFFGKKPDLFLHADYNKEPKTFKNKVKNILKKEEEKLIDYKYNNACITFKKPFNFFEGISKQSAGKSKKKYKSRKSQKNRKNNSRKKSRNSMKAKK